MIAKKIPNTKKSSTKAARAFGLAEYITEPQLSNELEKCIYSEAVNFLSTDLKSQAAEMVALSQEAVKSKDPIDHWVLSWKSNEHPTPAQAREAAAIFIKHCGLEGHQYIIGLHDDTENRHLHIAVNRVHPDTCKVVKINKGFDKEAAQQSIAIIEKVQGWSVEKNARYRTNANAELIIDPVTRRPKTFKEGEKQHQPTTKAQAMEIQTGEKSAQRVGIEEAWPIIKAATSWRELHAAMQSFGMSYQRKGSGAVIQVNDVVLKASDVDRKASIGALEKRFGPYQPPIEINPNEYHHHTTHTARTATGAIVVTHKSNAPAAGKNAGHNLRTLSQCGLAHSEEGQSTSRPSVLHVDARADRQRAAGLRRDAGRGASGPGRDAASSGSEGLRISNGERESDNGHSGRRVLGQPLKPNQPGWVEYQAIKSERSKAKAAELLAQRKQHDADKNKLHAEHVAERADVLKGSWRGKGDQRNALVSVLAAKHAAEKLALREHHQDEREALRARYMPLPQYQAWQQQPRLLAPVAAMPRSSKRTERLSNTVLALTHSADGRGIAYRDKGQELFIDQGRTLAVVNHASQTSMQIAAALAVAQQKYGVELTVTGSDAFKRQAVEAAVEHNLFVKFADPEMEAQRLQMIEVNRQSVQAARRAEQTAAQAAQEAKRAAEALALDQQREAAEQKANQVTPAAEPTPIQTDPAQPVPLDGFEVDADQAQAKSALVDKYKEVGRGVAPGELQGGLLETAVLVEHQGGIAVYRHRGEHYIQPIEQNEQERQVIRQKSHGVQR